MHLNITLHQTEKTDRITKTDKSGTIVGYVKHFSKKRKRSKIKKKKQVKQKKLEEYTVFEVLGCT